MQQITNHTKTRIRKTRALTTDWHHKAYATGFTLALHVYLAIVFRLSLIIMICDETFQNRYAKLPLLDGLSENAS